MLCLAWITIPATAFADAAASTAAGPAEARDTGTQGLAEIVVTANKVEEASSKVGLTIQTIDHKALAQEHIATLQDLAYSVPGLTFTEIESSTPVYTLRGVGFYETSLAAYPDVSVYLDSSNRTFRHIHRQFSSHRLRMTRTSRIGRTSLGRPRTMSHSCRRFFAPIMT